METLIARIEKAYNAGPDAFATAVAQNPEWAVLLAKGNRVLLLKWIARNHAAAVLRWLHGISPLSRNEVESARLLQCFVRACDLPTLEWLETVCPIVTFASGFPTMLGLVKHGGPAALATAEWVQAHWPGRYAHRTMLVRAAILSGDLPLVRYFMFGEINPRTTAPFVWVSGSVDILRWYVEIVPDPERFLFARGVFRAERVTPAMLEYLTGELGEARIAPGIRTEMLCNAIEINNLPLAMWLKARFPLAATDERIRATINVLSVIECLARKSSSIPMLKWLERVCPLRPEGRLTAVALNVVRSNMSIEDTAYCLEHYGGNICDTRGLIGAALVRGSVERVRWLMSAYRLTPQAVWGAKKIFLLLDALPAPVQFAQELQAAAGITRELMLAALPDACATVNVELLRWLHSEIPFTLDDVRTVFATPCQATLERSLMRPNCLTGKKPEAAICAYIDFLDEIGTTTPADWLSMRKKALISAIGKGDTCLAERARDCGIDAEQVRTSIVSVFERCRSVPPAAQILTEIFGLSCREVRLCAAAAARRLTKNDVAYLRDRMGLCAEDLRANDYAVARESLLRPTNIQMFFSGDIGLTREDAAAFLNHLGEHPFLHANGLRLRDQTRRILRRLAKGGD